MKHYIWSFLNTILTRGFAFIFSIILGNILLPGDLGLYVTVVLVITYFANILSLNLGSGIIHKLNNQNEQQFRNNYFTAGFIYILAFSLVGTLIFLGLKSLIVQIFDISEARYVLNLVFMLIPVNMLRIFFLHLMQSEMEFKKLTFINLSAVLVQTVVSVLLVYLGYNLEGVFYGLYSGQTLGLLLVSLMVFKRFRFILNKETQRKAPVLIKFSSIIFVGSIAVLLDRRVDMLFVAHYLDKSTVAVYSYALKFSLFFLLIGNSFSRVSYPRFSKAFSDGANTTLGRIFQYSIDFSFLFITVTSMIFLFNAEPIIGWLLPPYYLEAVPFLLILFIGVVPQSVVSSTGTIFTAGGIPSVSAKINWMLLALNVILNFFLIPIYGLYGAAIATSTTFLLKPALIFYLLSRKTEIKYTYTKLVAGFGIFIAFLFLGEALTSLYFKSLLIGVYTLLCVLYFLNKDERIYLSRNFSQVNKQVLSYLR